MDGYLLLVAAAAGSTEQEAVEAARAVLADAAPTEVAVTDAPADIDAALDRLAGRTLVVAGGDGTLHLVVAALDRRGALAAVRLGLVPLGTGNDLARTLDLPLDAGAAAARVVRGRPQPLDLVRSGREVVLNAAHAGIGVLAAERAADLKDAIGPAAYAAGAAAAGVEADGLALHLEVDGVPLGDGAPLLLAGVGNGRTIGSGTLLFPDADPADGLLDVVAVADRGVWDRLRLGLAARRGTHGDLDGVLTARGREVTVRGEAGWDDDGELTDSVPERVLRVDPGAWALVR